MILTENDVIQAWLRERNVKRAVFEDAEPINIYNNWSDESIDIVEPYNGDDFVEHCTGVDNWNMPDDYKKLNIIDYVINRCKKPYEAQRAYAELAEYEKRGMIPVLQFLCYLVDVCKENNVVLGVGRGSSVASYVLYLIGVHKIDSIKYDLDIKEFLK